MSGKLTTIQNSVNKTCILYWLRQFSIKTFNMNLFLENGIAFNSKCHTKINLESSKNVKLKISLPMFIK